MLKRRVLAFLPLFFSSWPAAHAASVQPVVLANFDCLVGGMKDGTWMDGKTLSTFVAKGQKYHLYNQQGKTGEAVCSDPDPAPNNAVPGRANDFEVKCPYDKDKTTTALVALASPHNPLPRPVKTLKTPAPAHTESMRAFLAKKGIAQPKVKIEQVYLADLEGDGQDEVLLTATYYRALEKANPDPYLPNRSKAGEYSVVLMRKIAKGRVEDVELISDVFPKADPETVPTAFTIRGLFDIDGDGSFEILLEAAYYEGSYSTFHRVVKGKLEDMIKDGPASCGWGA